MAKLTNIQTRLQIETKGKDETSFVMLALFVKNASAQGIDQFWRRYEIIKLLKDKAIGDEVEFTADQTKELKEFLSNRAWPVNEEWAELLESFKPVL